jgi:hypothetical protein
MAFLLEEEDVEADQSLAILLAGVDMNGMVDVVGSTFKELDG